MLPGRRHPAERVMVGDEGGAVGMAEAARIAGIVVIVGHVAPLAVHVEKRRRHLPERVVPVGTPSPSRPSNRAMICRPRALS